MRNIDPAFLSELKANASLPVVTLLHFIMGISVDPQYFFFTTNDTDLLWDGHRWEARAIDWENMSFGNDQIVTNISFSIDDVDKRLYPFFVLSEPLPYDLHLYLASLDDNYQVQATVMLFRGFIDLWEYDQTVIKVEASSLFNQWSRKTLRMFSGSCRWAEFKGPECQYIGEQTRCDRTYTECHAYGNVANFGGFRWLPRLQNKKINWGKDEGFDIMPLPW
jgi:hypothetical protein